MKRITFKSIPEIWRKEYLGLKSNTIRQFTDSDVRKEILLNYIQNKVNLLEVEIVNTETKESFVMTVKDVTSWIGYYIISWWRKDDKKDNVL